MNAPLRTPALSLVEYYDRLARFDWDHESTDDPHVWRAARAEYDDLRRLAVTDEHKEMLGAFEAHHGARNRKADGWDCTVPPLPVRPSANVTCEMGA